MSSASDVVSIDTEAVKRLKDCGETAVDDIQSQWDVLRKVLRQAIDVNGSHDKSDLARAFVNDVRDTVIKELGELNGHIQYVIDLIENPPRFKDPWEVWISGANTYVPLDGIQGLNTDWTCLRKEDRQILIDWAPDLVLGMSNVPEEVRDAAERAWFEAVDSDVEVYGRELSLNVHVRVLWVDVNVGLTNEITVYADGSVRVEYMATGELGAAVGAGVAKAEAGVEMSAVAAHHFDSMQDFERFEAQLKQEILSVDVDGVASMLLGKSATNLVTKVGVYGGFQAGVGSGQLMEARLAVGVGRDWRTEENILYLSGRVALHESGGMMRSSSASLGTLATGQVELVGERRQGVETDRVVLDIAFETRLSALSSLLGDPKSLVNNVRGNFRADVEVVARLELDLEDLDAREAWDSFMDGDLAIGELFAYSSLDGRISTSATSKTGGGGSLGVISAQVTVGETNRMTLGTFHKESGMGRPTRWLSLPEIGRLSR